MHRTQIFVRVLLCGCAFMLLAACAPSVSRSPYQVEALVGSIDGYSGPARNLSVESRDTPSLSEVSTGRLSATGVVNLTLNDVPADAIEMTMAEFADGLARCTFTIENAAAGLLQIGVWSAPEALVAFGDPVGMWLEQRAGLNSVVYSTAATSIVNDGPCDTGAQQLSIDWTLEPGWNAVTLARHGTQMTYTMGFDDSLEWTILLD